MRRSLNARVIFCGVGVCWLLWWEGAGMSGFPCLVRSVSGLGEVRYSLGDRLVDWHLVFVAGRARPNTLRAVAFDLRAVAFDLKAFFTVLAGKDPVEIAAADVFEFLAHQRGDRSVVRLADRESGLSARTIARRLSSVSGLYAYLVARGDTPARASPVPRGLSTRQQGGSRASRMVMLLAGLRRCEVLGLRMADVRAGDRQLFIAEGKGGHHRVILGGGDRSDQQRGRARRHLQRSGDLLRRPVGVPQLTNTVKQLLRWHEGYGA
jgi:integrase/recombinase XerD